MAIRDAAVDTKTVPLLVIPPQREHLAGAQPENQEHADDEPVTVAQVEQDLRNLFRREVLRSLRFPDFGTASLAAGFFGNISNSTFVEH